MGKECGANTSPLKTIAWEAMEGLALLKKPFSLCMDALSWTTQHSNFDHSPTLFWMIPSTCHDLLSDS